MKQHKILLCQFFKLLCAVSILTACTEEKAPNWRIHLPNTGTYSSPRLTDINGDGVLDIILGAGGKEAVYSDTAIIALDGTSGQLLWKVPGHNQYVGSALFKDVTGDGIDDIFIGGRWAQLTAINGANGQTIWTFFEERKTPDAAYAGWYNFTTPQFVPDKDADGIQDMIIANGGNPLAPPNDPNRPAGRLLVLSSRSGKILANVQVPDERETYTSVVCSPIQKDGNMTVLFGTGGETIGGHLFRTTLNDIMRGDISEATVLATSESKGFVASPVYADVNGDDINDVIVNAVDGRMMAISGATDSLLWQVYFPGTEAYTIPAVGYFNKDGTPDFFTNFAIGVFPNLTRSVRFMVDGKTGKIEYTDTTSAFQYASPVAADLNNDGFDEVLVNTSELKRKQFENVYFSYLQAFDFVNNRIYSLGDTIQATNLASTPWIGDMDGNNQLDIVYSAVNYNDTRFDLQRPMGLWVAVYRPGIEIKKPVRWGAFMGSDYTGIFK